MTEIPIEFYSYETNAPFERCISCNKYLLNENTEYLIEKAYKNHSSFSVKDVVFDYAICMDCAEEMRKEISKESWLKMMDYFEQNVKLNNSNDYDLNERMSHCLIKGKHIDDCKEYQIYAHCKGKYLNLDNPPYVLCGEAMDEIIELLSEQTLGEMNKFFQKHFSPDPSFFEPTPKLILV